MGGLSIDRDRELRRSCKRLFLMSTEEADGINRCCMDPEAEKSSIKSSAADYRLSAFPAFLSRLEDKADGPAELIPMPEKKTDRTKEHRCGNAFAAGSPDTREECRHMRIEKDVDIIGNSFLPCIEMIE